MSESNGILKPSPSSASLAHLKAYPLVDDLIKFGKTFTLVNYLVEYAKQLESLIVPYLSKLPYLTQSLSGVDAFVDDSVLTKFDQIFPAITKLTAADLHPFVLYGKFRTIASTKYHALVEGVLARIHSIEESTRPILAKRLEFVLSPFNNLLESAIEKYLPQTPKLDTSGSKDEFAKLYQLVSSIYSKSVPLVSSTKDQVIQLPHEVSSHITGVYKEELSSSKNSSEAFAKTSRKLSTEAIQSLKPIVYDPIVSTVGNIRSSTQVKLNTVFDTTKNNIDGIVTEVKNGIDTGALNGSVSTSSSAPIVSASA